MKPHWALLAGAVAALFLVHVVYLEGVAEDAFISFRFARNWVEGHGLVWNPGEAPVEGYTNFLWLVLVAGLLGLGLDPLLGSQLLGVAASLATLALLYRAGVRSLSWSPGEALLPCAFLALAGPFATWAGGGMETNLFALWLLAGVCGFAAWAQDGRRGSLFVCFFALLLASLTRPEGALVFALVLALALLAGVGRPGALRELAAPVGISLALFLLYFAWRWSYFGQALPNTFYAKTGGGTAQFLRGARYALAFLRDYGLPWLPLLAVALLPQPATAAAGGARARSPAALAGWLRGHALLSASGAVSGLWLASVVALGGDYMAMYRFFVPVLPFLYLLLAAATRRALRTRALDPGPRRALLAGGLSLAVLGTALHSTPLELLVVPEPAQRHGNWRGVQTERWHVARLSEIGRFFAGYARSPSESLVTDAIGAISWYSGIRIYGVHGIVDRELARDPARRRNIGRSFAGHERGELAYFFSKRPSFMMFGRELSPRRPGQFGLPGGLDPEVVTQYGLASVWLEDPRNGEAGYFSFLERRDR